ncbi:MAG: hypothetical protein WBN95_11290 [Gammaproteobacteria bacterium]
MLRASNILKRFAHWFTTLVVARLEVCLEAKTADAARQYDIAANGFIRLQINDRW